MPRGGSRRFCKGRRLLRAGNGTRRIRQQFVPLRHSRESGNPYSYPVSCLRGDEGAVKKAIGSRRIRPPFRHSRESGNPYSYPAPASVGTKGLWRWIPAFAGMTRRAAMTVRGKAIGSRRIRPPFRHSRESGNPYSYPAPASVGTKGLWRWIPAFAGMTRRAAMTGEERPSARGGYPPLRHSRESGNPYSYPVSCLRGDEGAVTTVRRRPSARGGCVGFLHTLESGNPETLTRSIDAVMRRGRAPERAPSSRPQSP